MYRMQLWNVILLKENFALPLSHFLVMFSITRRFDDDIKFIEKHKDIALRQVALWDAKFQELSKVFNIPIGDMKLHAVSREPSLFSREFFFNDYS